MWKELLLIFRIWMGGWMNGKLDILYADIHINIYNMYIIYINDQATDQHYQSMVLSTYIHTYL